MVFDLFYAVFGILTEVSDLIGFSFRFKERGTQKHTQSVKQHHGRPAADRKGCLTKANRQIISQLRLSKTVLESHDETYWTRRRYSACRRGDRSHTNKQTSHKGTNYRIPNPLLLGFFCWDNFVFAFLKGHIASRICSFPIQQAFCLLFFISIFFPDMSWNCSEHFQEFSPGNFPETFPKFPEIVRQRCGRFLICSQNVPETFPRYFRGDFFRVR